MPPEDERKRTIDERLEALTQSVELLTRDVHQMQEVQAEMQAQLEAESRERRAEMDRLDARERNAREALLAGISAYLRALRGNGEV